MKLLRLIATVICLTPAWVGAHGDLDARLAAATREIEQHPGDATWLVRRGELHREHRDWGAALADFEQAARLQPSLPRDFLCSRTLAEGGFATEARRLLDRHLSRHPAHAEALVARARLREQLRDLPGAAADLTAALAAAPSPDLYVERAELLRRAGRLGEAVTSLDEGMQRLGPLPVLQSLAVELEVARSRPDAAITRINRLLARTVRPEFLFTRRAEIQALAGNGAEARADFKRAREAVNALPPAQRNVPAIAELLARIDVGARQLDQAAAATGPMADNRGGATP